MRLPLWQPIFPYHRGMPGCIVESSQLLPSLSPHASDAPFPSRAWVGVIAPQRVNPPETKKRARPQAFDGLEPGIYLATTYSHRTYRPTTIGAAAFHFRVRNGTGWFHRALVTRGQSWEWLSPPFQDWTLGILSLVWGLLPLPAFYPFLFRPLSDIHTENILILKPDNL